MVSKLNRLYSKLFKTEKKISFENNTNLKIFNDKILKRSLYFNNFFKIIENIEGTILECGVGEGVTLSILCSLNLLEKKDRLIWGFDSFEGFPKPTKEDDLNQEKIKGLEDYKVFNIEYVYKTLTEFGISKADIDRKIILAKGFMPESFSLYDSKPIALLHLDLDLYLSYKDSINFFYDKVAKGGIIAFDEYNKPMDIAKWPGAVKAINEFLDSKNLRDSIIKNSITGNIYFIKK